MNSAVRFIRAHPDAPEIVRSDKSALGTLPAAAFQYCEAVRTASSFGWYGFPATNAMLRYNGIDTFMHHEQSGWEKLHSEHVEDPDAWWNSSCPDSLTDLCPPFISSISKPGIIQIWTGYLVETSKDWNILIRPLVNTQQTSDFVCFEGLVETDHFCPAPLFVNIQLKTLNIPIDISTDVPLIQIQPIHRCCLSTDTLNNPQRDMLTDMTELDWQLYRRTIRSKKDPADQPRTGRYAAATRKRSRAETEM